LKEHQKVTSLLLPANLKANTSGEATRLFLFSISLEHKNPYIYLVVLMNFENLNLHSGIITCVHKLGYGELTPIDISEALT